MKVVGMAVDSNELEALMESAGVAERARKRMREANYKPKSGVDSPDSRGHGAPARVEHSAGSL